MRQRVKMLQERGFEAGIMNDDGALVYLIGTGGSICGLGEFVPDVGCRKCPRWIRPGDAGNALHRRRDVDIHR